MSLIMQVGSTNDNFSSRHSRPRTFVKHQDIISLGDTPTCANILLSGLACRYNLVHNGRRQITAILVPGDICDLEPFMKGTADFSVCALTSCNVAAVSMDKLGDREGCYLQAYKLLRLDEAIGRQWIINLGQRSAVERIAHFFCEMHARLSRAGLTQDNSFDFPIIQSDLADVLGLSTVHVNRSLQDLRSRGWIGKKLHRFVIFDLPSLQALAHFDINYLM